MRLIRRASCPRCGERIGVYEPTIVVEPDGHTRLSSLAHEPDLLDTPDRIFHQRCGTPTIDPPDPQ